MKFWKKVGKKMERSNGKFTKMLEWNGKAKISDSGKEVEMLGVK